MKNVCIQRSVSAYNKSMVNNAETDRVINTDTRSYMRKYHFLYKTTCTVTGRYYVGVHSTDNIDDDYLGSGKRFRFSVEKHGRENHKREILEMFSDRKSLLIRESEIVNDDLLNDELCMNLVKGGGGFLSIEDETKRRMSMSHLGRKNSPEARAKISAALMGHQTSEETRKLIGDAHRGKIVSNETRVKMAASQTGKKLSLEIRKKISVGNMGKVQSEETKAKIARSHIGKKHSEETRLKMSQNRKGRIPWNKGKVGVQVCSDETREKMSATRKGRRFSDEHKRAISEARKGFKITEETRAKLSAMRAGVTRGSYRRRGDRVGGTQRNPCVD